MESNVTNPAARLLEILTQAKRDFSGNRNTTALKDVWAKVFSVSPPDPAEILQPNVALINLARSGAAAVERLHSLDRKIYLAPFRQVEMAFVQTTLKSRWADSDAHVPDTVIVGLTFVADRLATEPGVLENVLSQETLQHIHEQAQALLEEIVESDLPTELKGALADQLDQLIRLIRHYRIYGAQALKEFVDRAVGTVIRHHGEVQQSQTGRKFVEIVRTVDTVVASALHLHQLAGPILQALPSILRQG